MEFKGTPGPWKWNGEDYRGDWGWQILVGPEGQGIIIGEAHDGVFDGLRAHQDVSPELCKTGFEAPENGAAAVHVRYHNAQLIVSAPDLLKELQRLEVAINTISYCYRNKPENFASAIKSAEDDAEQARAAIAKAIGKEE